MSLFFACSAATSSTTCAGFFLMKMLTSFYLVELTTSYLPEFTISYLVSVTKDVGSVAAKQVNVLLAIQIPNFAAISSGIKLKRYMGTRSLGALRAPTSSWGSYRPLDS